MSTSELLTMRFFILAFFSFFRLKLVAAGECFHCVSPDNHLAPALRTQVKTQIDVFFWQIGTQWHACSKTVDPQNPAIHGQLCSKYDLCVTLQPNINGTTFVIRGCLESVLRHNWKDDPRLHSEGCYMVRSMPIYPNTQVIDYVICVCRGNYCNGEHSVAFVEGVQDFPRDAVLRLAPKDEFVDEQPKYEVGSSSASSFTLICRILFSIFFHICRINVFMF